MDRSETDTSETDKAEELRRGSATSADSSAASLWLDHAAIMTADLDPAVNFYTSLLGLRVNIVVPDPIRKGRRRAMLFDSNGRDVLEIIEMKELRHRVVPGAGAVHHLGFRFPTKDWSALRDRLQAREYPYEEVAGRLFVRDVDGLVLEIEPF
ncbi:MAG: VOC family protein [Rhodothermales bacterium]|nr:VOC family protein [Rhodothermales bacterium]